VSERADHSHTVDYLVYSVNFFETHPASDLTHFLLQSLRSQHEEASVEFSRNTG
jgi:hypothetical protein